MGCDVIRTPQVRSGGRLCGCHGPCISAGWAGLAAPPAESRSWVLMLALPSNFVDDLALFITWRRCWRWRKAGFDVPKTRFFKNPS